MHKGISAGNAAGRLARLFRAGAMAASMVTLAAVPAAALVPAPPGGPESDPNPPPQIGPAVPYIAGRFAGTQPVASPPPGAVVPDDFCIPGKLNDCGDHLRDQPAPAAAGPEMVVFGDPADAFAEARNSAWLEGQMRQTEQLLLGETTTSRNLSLGVDRRLGERFLLGIMVTSSQTTFSVSGSGRIDRGRGLLYGPYFAFELSDDWAIDGRYLVGSADHDVSAGGTLTGQYQSRESYGALRISGEVPLNGWRLNPSLQVTRLQRDDPPYVDGIIGPVAARSTVQTFTTGTLLGYYDGLSLANGALTPYAGFEISQLAGSGGPFGAARAGLAVEFANGGLLNLDYAYGAIGLDNVTDSQVTLRLEVPF